MCVFLVFLSLLLPAFGFVWRRRDEIRLLRQFMPLYPDSVPKSVSKPEREQHVHSDGAALVEAAANMSSSARTGAASAHWEKCVVLNLSFGKYRHATERSCGLEMKTAEDTIACIQMIT